MTDLTREQIDLVKIISADAALKPFGKMYHDALWALIAVGETALQAPQFQPAPTTDEKAIQAAYDEGKEYGYAEGMNDTSDFNAQVAQGVIEIVQELAGENLGEMDADYWINSLRESLELPPYSKPAPPRDVVADLAKNWNAFCDADNFKGAHDFPERMEAAGLIELVPVDDDALDEAFATDRGIVKGGNMWVLSERGRAAIEAITRLGVKGE